MAGQRQPLGVELAKRNLITENDINMALEYQKSNPGKKLGDILNILNICDSKLLIEAMGEILEEKAIYLTMENVLINPQEFFSIDIMKENMAVPFDEDNGKIKVCFSDTSNNKSIDKIRLLLLNKGLVMDKYITFESNIETVISGLEGSAGQTISSTGNTTSVVDSIIKTAIEKRASDIHFEPMVDSLRVRYRIDGKLINAATIDKDKQARIIGRLKAISNMHQEKQESQDGRILMYPDYNIRVSSQKNIYGEKFVLRLLRKNGGVRKLSELGFTENEKTIKEVFDKRNSITIIAAPTGAGKTTTLYSVVDLLNKPEINITTIEDPVEIRIDGINQIEIDDKTSFNDSLKNVLRQDPDIILLGEIRDKESAETAMQAGQTGHYVLSTIHTIDAIEVITRLRKFGISDYDISSTLASSISQRLVRKVCPKCAKERAFNDNEKKIMNNIAKKYGVELNFDNKKTYDIVGCDHCNNTGYYDRTAIFEVLVLNEKLRELIGNNCSSLEIRNEAMKSGYKPLVLDGLQKVLDGIITLDELRNVLALF